MTTRVVFGSGTIAEAAGEVERLGHGKALVLSTPHQKADAERLAAIPRDNPEYTPYFDATVATLASLLPHENDEERVERAGSLLNYRIGELAKPTIKSIAGGDIGHIMIYPEYGVGENYWTVFIPPTRPEHIEGDPLEGNILAPYGETTWPTVAEAVEFLREVIASGQLVSNQGRVLE